MADLNNAIVIDMTITQLYNHEMALRIMLNAIGVAERERNRLIDDGFTSMKTIMDLHPNDVAGFQSYLKNLNKTFASSGNENLQVYFSPVNISRLVGVTHYFNHSINSFHMIPDILMVDSDDASDYATHYREFIKEPEDEVEVKVPLLLGSTNWIDFREKFIMKISRTKGTRGIALNYVIDSTPRTATRINAAKQEVNTVDISDDEIFTTQTTHFGRSFKADNKTVWEHLKNLNIGHPPYNHISRFNSSANGRGAWIALKTFYEGEDFQERMRESAFTKLTNTFYKGETSRFSFEKYVEVHKSAHKMLEDCNYNNGLGMDDPTKIQHFKTGIKTEAGLEHAMTHIRANPQLRQFDQLISFLSAEVDHKNTRRLQLNSLRDRRIAALDKAGRGNGRGRGGRGRGGRSGRDRLESKVVDGKTISAKRYSRDEFRSLTDSQRNAVIEMNRARRQKNSPPPPPNNVSSASISELRDDMISMGEAIVAGVQRATGEDVSVVTGTTDASSDQSPTGTTKRKATSGSVGDFIRDRRQRNN
jgi:hypothetical protein